MFEKIILQGLNYVNSSIKAITNALAEYDLVTKSIVDVLESVERRVTELEDADADRCATIEELVDRIEELEGKIKNLRASVVSVTIKEIKVS
jgi:TolA-binding protein